MRKLRNILATFLLVMTLMVSVTSAKTGLLVSDLSDQNTQPCIETNDNSKLDWGVIVTGFTGVIVTGFTGVIVTGAIETPVDCGILMTD
jgi:hypothetical protein